jgi:dephospho-CoA kinase
MAMTTRLGLTGGIGSGKSTVSAMFAKLGASVIDADAISRNASSTGGVAMPAIERVFGASFLSADGSLNRDAMRGRIFTDHTAKTQLEAIIHPIVGQEINRLELLAIASNCHLIIFDIPLLVESSQWRPRLDLVMVVDCEPETQIQRVMRRSGWPREQVRQVIATQASRAQRLAAADIVICNEGLDFEGLMQQVQQCARQLGLSSGYDGV